MKATATSIQKGSIDDLTSGSSAIPQNSMGLGLKKAIISSASGIPLPNIRPRCTTTTDETSSDGAFSHVSSDHGQQYEVIEYDFARDAVLGVEPSELFAEVVGKTAVINIDADSPAAAALRANARIHVSSVGKAARAVQLQSVRRVLKRATGITKSGKKKGKPPRIPPTLLHTSNHNNNLVVDAHVGAADANDANHPLREGFDEDGDDDKEEDPESTAHSDTLRAKLDPPRLVVDDYSSFSQGGGDMDESRNSLASHVIKPSMGAPEKVLDRETMHIPDGVAPGTVEAGKKGMSLRCDPHRLFWIGSNTLVARPLFSSSFGGSL
jgi:hypothetical protein